MKYDHIATIKWPEIVVKWTFIILFCFRSLYNTPQSPLKIQQHVLPLLIESYAYPVLACRVRAHYALRAGKNRFLQRTILWSYAQKWIQKYIEKRIFVKSSENILFFQQHFI